MIEKWLDVTITDKTIFISDWTHTMQFINKMRHSNNRDGHRWEQDYWRYQREFKTVKGKIVTYHVKGLGVTDEQAREIAIKYHIATENGSIGKYRLD